MTSIRDPEDAHVAVPAHSSADQRLQRAVVVLGVLLVLAVLAAAFLTYKWQAFDDHPLGVSKQDIAVPTAHQRANAVATAEQFALRMDALDGSHMSAYTKNVSALLTTKYKADFEKQYSALEKFQFDPKTKGQGKILSSAISDIDVDSALVLVAHDNNVTSSRGPSLLNNRWTVSLQKVGGKWLVDDFTEVK